MPDERVKYAAHVFLGFIGGLLLSALCFALAFAIGGSSTAIWAGPLTNALSLTGVGILIYFGEYARPAVKTGLIISLSLVFMLNGACWALYFS